MSEVLQVERDDRDVVTVTFNRPEVKNAFDSELMGKLADTAQALAGDQSVRALVLTGAGSAFSAGADLNWMASMAGYSYEENVADSGRFEAMLRAVRDFPAPVLARVNGHAIAGASGLLGCVDIAIAVRGARFGFTEAKLGLVPAMISAYVLPRIGLTNAHRYLLTGELFDADRALAIGLVHDVCDPEDLDEVFGRVLDEVLAAAPGAQREVKRLIATVAAATDPRNTEQLRIETISRARTGDEAQQRIRAFFERKTGTNR